MPKAKPVEADRRKTFRVVIDGVEKELRRFDLVRIGMAKKLAEHKVRLIQSVHRTDKNKIVDVEANPQWAAIWADPSPDTRIAASAQSGKSLDSVVTLCAAADLGLECGYILPTNDKRNEFVNNRITRTFGHTPYYRDKVKAAGGADSNHEKQWLAMDDSITSIHFATAASEHELIAYSADLQIVDEMDRCDRVNLRLYPSRMEQSPYQLTRHVSTPTLPGYKALPGQVAPDNIWSDFLGGTQNKWHVTCPYCATMQVPEWYTHIVAVNTDDAGRIVNFNVRDQDWSPGDATDVRIVCTTCKRPFDRMTKDARWISLEPGAKIKSWWVNRICSEIGKPISEIVDRFGRALNNPTMMQQVHNMDLGIPYAGGFVGFREELFARCSQPDPFTMPDFSDRPTTCGIDVNIPFFDIQISEWNKDPKCPQRKVFAGKILGRQNLYAILRKYNVRYGIIEQQPELNLAIEIQAEMKAEGRWLTRSVYSTHELREPIVISEIGDGPFDMPIRVTLDRTSTLDGLYATMLERRVKWFSNYREICDGAVLGEMSRPVRVVDGTPGVPRFAWVGEPDHQLHAANLDLVAGTLSNSGVTPYTSPIVVKTDYSTTFSGGKPPAAGTPESQILDHMKKVGADKESVEARKKAREFKPLIIRSKR